MVNIVTGGGTKGELERGTAGGCNTCDPCLVMIDVGGTVNVLHTVIV